MFTKYFKKFFAIFQPLDNQFIGQSKWTDAATSDDEGWTKVQSRKSRTHIDGVPEPDSVEWKWLSTDSMVDEVDRVFNERISISPIKKRRQNPKKVKNPQKILKKKIIKSQRKKKTYEGHYRETTPTVVSFLDYSYAFILLCISTLIYFMTPGFSDALAVYKPVLGNEISIDYYDVVVELYDVYVLLFLVTVLYISTRCLFSFMLWFFEKATVVRRARRITKNGVFKDSGSTKANFEMLMKVIFCTAWKDPMKAAMSLTLILQIFRPTATVTHHVEAIIKNTVSLPNYEGQSAIFEKIVSPHNKYIGHFDMTSADDRENLGQDGYIRFGNEPLTARRYHGNYWFYTRVRMECIGR